MKHWSRHVIALPRRIDFVPGPPLKPLPLPSSFKDLPEFSDTLGRSAPSSIFKDPF